MGKPTICIGENKGADQLRSNCEADQRLCFRYTDSTLPLLFKSSGTKEGLSYIVCSLVVRAVLLSFISNDKDPTHEPLTTINSSII